MERAFEYDEKLVASCSASGLLQILANNTDHFSDHEHSILIANTQDEACWDLFVQHGAHFQRPVPESVVLPNVQVKQLFVNSHVLQRFQQFLVSVRLVNEHNNHLWSDLSSFPSFRLTLNRFSDTPKDELPVQRRVPSQANRRLSLGLDELGDQDDGDDGAAWFHPWQENSGGVSSKESDNTPLTRLADRRDIRQALHSSSWGIGHGSIGRLDPAVHHHHHHNSDRNNLNSGKHHTEKRKDFAVPVDQSAFAQVPFPDDDVAVSKLNGKELAIKQAKPSRHKKHHPPENISQSEGDDNDNDDTTNDGDGPDDDKTLPLKNEPPTYLNWATTENPDGVPLVHDVFDQVC